MVMPPREGRESDLVQVITVEAEGHGIKVIGPTEKPEEE
jgi:hypothetical protein